MASGTPLSQRANLLGILVLTATAVLLLLTGYWRMFAHFPGYDDEGYILLTVRSYLEHGGLYGKVYSQYGPGFYVLLEGLQRLTGAAIDHEFARWFTLSLWGGGAAGAGALVGRVTRSRSMAWFTGVTIFIYLHQFNLEAFHPGAVVVFLLPVLLWVMLELIRRERTGWAAAAAGAGAAGLGLLKINVGVLFAVGCGVWLVLTTGPRWRSRGFSWGGVAGGILFAAAFMHGLLDAAWVRTFLVLFAVGLIGLGAVISARPGLGYRSAAAFVTGAVGVVVLVAAIVMHRGTTAGALWAGVILGPMKHASAYSFPVDWRPGTLGLALASIIALAGHRWLRSRGRAEAADRLVVTLRLVQILGLLSVVALLGQFRVVGALFSYAIPWLWVWLVPLQEVPPRQEESGGRGLVACVLLLQMLHAYPVGGIQLSWGSFLLFALVAMAVPETSSWLEGRLGTWLRGRLVLSGLLVLVAGTKAGLVAKEYHDTYTAGWDLALPGTGGMRLSEREAATYQTVVTNSVLHADMIFSLPGMFSFNLWSDRPTPTQRNTTLWYSLLGEPDQRAIIESLERARRPGLVVDWALVSILRNSGAPPTGPLYDYLMSNYRPAFGLRGLGFWVKNGREIAPVGTAAQLRGPDGKTVFRLCLLGTGEPVESMELFAPDQTGAERLMINARHARISIQPVNPDGSPRAATWETGWPFRFDGLAWITVSSDQLKPLPPDSAWMLVLNSRDNRRINTALFVDPQ